MGFRKPGLFDRAIHYTIRVVVYLAVRVYFRVRIKNRPKLAGGYVVVANHSSFLDPVILGAAQPGFRARRVIFLISGTVARSRLMGWFFRWNRVVPVAQTGVQRDAIRTAREALAAGETIGVFPEGGISRDGMLMLGNPGAVSLVLSGDVPVVPLGLVGVDRALPPGKSLPRPYKIELRYGDPVPASELGEGAHRKEKLASATRRIMQELAKLTEQTAWEDELEKLAGIPKTDQN